MASQDCSTVALFTSIEAGICQVSGGSPELYCLAFNH